MSERQNEVFWDCDWDCDCDCDCECECEREHAWCEGESQAFTLVLRWEIRWIPLDRNERANLEFRPAGGMG